MDRKWLLIIFVISAVFLSLLALHDKRSLAPFYTPEKVVKVPSFQEARSRVRKDDLELLKLWESMLTGRAAPLSRLIKERYQLLGLNHLFTPSGFHLSAVLFPFMKILKKKSHQFYLLLMAGLLVSFLPGLGALKRMMLIKTHQHLLGLKLGFFIALAMDMFFGSFQSSALSFTYSFLFLGIIYSGAKALPLVLLFFVGQIVLALFQNGQIAPLILVCSPLLNLVFGFLMPLLFVLSFPLWDWQLDLGIMALRAVQALVDVSAFITAYTPAIEINVITIVLIILIFMKKWKLLLLFIGIFSGSLNPDLARNPTFSKNDFIPQGKVLKTKYSEKLVYLNFSDGNCRLKLVRGYWWENCSPKRRSSRKKNN